LKQKRRKIQEAFNSSPLRTEVASGQITSQRLVRQKCFGFSFCCNKKVCLELYEKNKQCSESRESLHGVIEKAIDVP
jgi:hypothetical protein